MEGRRPNLVRTRTKEENPYDSNLERQIGGEALIPPSQKNKGGGRRVPGIPPRSGMW